jgi:hypothetical protein
VFPSLRQEGLEVPPSGVDFVPAGFNDFSITEPGGKCIHGIYIPANQIDQDGSDFCGICTSLKAFCEKTGLHPAQADARLYIWTNFSHEVAIELVGISDF